MALWLMMFVSVLLFPGIMIFFGWKFRRGGPEKINHFYGYRTRRSMMNRQTWDFAHRCIGRYWWKTGWWTLIPLVAVMLFLLGAEEDTVAVASTLLMVALCVPLMIPVFLTERRLKETFDDHGNRILPGDPADLDQM